MSEIEKLFDKLPGLIQRDGRNYSPAVIKDCDGYFSACYIEDDSNGFLYSDGAAYDTPEEALKNLISRLGK